MVARCNRSKYSVNGVEDMVAYPALVCWTSLHYSNKIINKYANVVEEGNMTIRMEAHSGVRVQLL